MLFAANSVLHCELGSRPNVWDSAMNVDVLDQQPSTAIGGLLRITLSRCGESELSAATASTHCTNVDQAGTSGTGLPRHITWFAVSPFASFIRSRVAKWNHW